MTQATPSLSERIADGIVAIIRSDGLAPGDALASSRQLAQRFEVTTPTVREALRRLEAVDVVRFRHGSGTYVGDGLDRRLLGNPHPPVADPRSVLELAQARLVLEPPIAAAAATHRTEADLERLEQAADNALVPQEGLSRPAVHFHAALAHASGNPLLGETVQSLLTLRMLEQVEIRSRYLDRDQDHREHRGILDAVRAEDAGATEALVREHLTHIRDAVADGLDQPTQEPR